MNTIEERLRAATRQTAAEIPPDGVPPLSLPTLSLPALSSPALSSPTQTVSAAGPGRGHAAPWSPPRRPGWPRLLAPLAAAAAVAAVVAVSVAVREAGPGKPADGRSAMGVSGVRITAGQRARLDTEVLDNFIPATGAEFTTGARLEGTTGAIEDAQIASCMARSGFVFQGASAAAIAAGFFDNSQFPDLVRIARFGTAPVPRGGGQPSWPAGKRRAYLADLGRCHDAAAKQFASLWRAGFELESPWISIVTRIQSSAKVRAAVPGLRSCAKRYGWPATPYERPATSMNSFTDFLDWIAAHIDGAGTRGASPAKMTRLERTWSPVFVTCARTTVAIQERLQSVAREVFIRRHIRQVRALEALALRLFTKAQRPGGTARNG